MCVPPCLEGCIDNYQRKAICNLVTAGVALAMLWGKSLPESFAGVAL